MSCASAISPRFFSASLPALPWDRVAEQTFLVASYLTDPICEAHACYRYLQVVEVLHPQSGKMRNVSRKIALYMQMAGWASLALFTTAPASIMRKGAYGLQTSSFLHVVGEGKEKVLPATGCFSLLSWNVCCVGGGYSISDGGVVPWRMRVDRIARRIIEKDPDVCCLYEVFDVQTTHALRKRLKNLGYAHVYFNMGPRAVGVSSGLCVLSKYAVDSPEFFPFPQETLVGRTQFTTKGEFYFGLKSQRRVFARIDATHLQHSEEPAFPTEEERRGREKQMHCIAERMSRVQGCCGLVVGDLNLDDKEYDASSWKTDFEAEGERGGDCTWGGDAFCATLCRKNISGPLNLDHVLVKKGTCRRMSTTLVDADYDASRFDCAALSDHKGLFSQVVV